jgi:hypothetical protein
MVINNFNEFLWRIGFLQESLADPRQGVMASRRRSSGGAAIFSWANGIY